MGKFYRMALMVLLGVLSLPFSSCSSRQKYTTLSSDLLQRATSIVYHCANGSVAPEYHYDCYVTVMKDSVDIKVCQSYNGNVVYQESCPVSEELYFQFLSDLAGQEIRKDDSKDIPITTGDGASAILVKAGEEVLFRGEEDVDLFITKGSLADSFLPLLSPSMLQAVNNPDEKLKEF